MLGIDPGLATVGYGVIETQGPNGQAYALLEAGVITTPPGAEVRDRLLHIYEETRGLIAEYAPEAMAVEKLFFKKNVTTGIAVAQARGVLLLAGCGLSLSEYAPLEVKRRVAGSGRAVKRQVQTMVQRLLGLSAPPRPDDAADAVAVALCDLLARRTPLGQLREAGRRRG